jgi:cytoskeletal protein CcmA (bactofilin family)
MKFSRFTLASLITAVSLTTSGCIIHVGGHNDDHDNEEFSSVFGGLDISENRQVGDLSSVNGNIVLQNGVRAENVDTANGNIELGENVHVQDTATVNGNIEAQANLIVSGDMNTVNGGISLLENSAVSKDITTVNGDIILLGTLASGDIETTNGDISLQKGSVVEGDIVFESKNDDNWLGNNNNDRLPTLTIDASSEVKGRIILNRKVILEIDNQLLLDQVERNYSTQE